MNNAPLVSFKFIEGRACPFYLCACCSKHIDDMATAWIVWDMNKEPSIDIHIMAVHKGKCLALIERYIEVEQGGYMGSAEALTFTDQLMYNSGDLPHQKKQEEKRLAEVASKRQIPCATGNKAKQRAKMTPSLRMKILARDNFECKICGRNPRDKVFLHVDHIIPIALGGLSAEDNLQTLCNECNAGKSSSIIAVDIDLRGDE